MEARWRIQLLGGLSATRGDLRITRFRPQKAGALLAYLAYHHQRTHPRDVLIELLWPECDPDRGRDSLSSALVSLRRQMEPGGHRESTPQAPLFLADHFSVGLNPEGVTTDVAEFEARLQEAAAAGSAAEPVNGLVEAVGLYAGPLLPGYYESWIVSEQQRLEELLFRSLRQLVTHFEQAGDLDRALEYGRQAISADPLREEAHQVVIRLHAAAGQPGAALRQYRELERILKQELNTRPGAATRALLVSLESRAAPGAFRTRPDAIERRVDSPTPPGASPQAAQAPSARSGLAAANTPPGAPEPAGGAVPLGSPFYITRPTDEKFAAAIRRQDSIVLVKGPRQVGKTSLLARGLQQARQAGARVVLTDLEVFNAGQLESAEAFLLALAQTVADQVDLAVSPDDRWEPRRGASPNFQRYLRQEILGAGNTPLVWGLNDVDRLFGRDFSSEIFALFRSWHNERALDPAGPWAQLTLVMAYATEAHLFITDLNKSPFNVGTRLTLEDFTPEQVAELNRRCGSPLADPAGLTRFYELVGGHPYLVRCGLDEMAAHGTPLAIFETRAGRDDWIFGDHLQRMWADLSRDPELCEVVRGLLAARPCTTSRAFYRLRSAGLVAGESEADARLRCRLYHTYLARALL